MPKKKKIPKASKKRLVVFGTLSVIIIGYFVFLLGYNIYKIYNLRKEQQTLSENYTSLKKEEKELRNEIDKLQDEDYIARYARENYSYSKDGEYIIKINDKDKKKEEKKKKIDVDLSDNYVIYGGVGIILLIIIHIIRKRK
mgnify:CR=1 FL=1